MDKKIVFKECLLGIALAMVLQTIILTTLPLGGTEPLSIHDISDIMKLIIALFSLPINFVITIFMAVWLGFWSLIITNVLVIVVFIFAIRFMQSKRIIKLRYRVASYLTLIGLLAVYNLPNFVG